MTNQTPQNSPSLSQNVDKLVADLQHSLQQYRDNVSDAIVNELDIPANVSAIKDLVKKKLQAKHTPTYVETIQNLDFGSKSLLQASQRMSQLPYSYTQTPMLESKKSIIDSSQKELIEIESDSPDENSHANLLADQLFNTLKQPKQKHE